MTAHAPTAYQVWSLLSLSALFGRVNLTFDLLASNLVHIITRQVCNLPTNFGVSIAYVLNLSVNTWQTCHVTSDLGGHGACRWCGSSCSVCVPSFKFVGLPIRKIWRTSGLSISRPGDLDLWPLSLKLMRIIPCSVDNLPTNFGVSRTFRSRLIGQHLSDTSHDLATLTFDLGGHDACRWCGSSCCDCIPSLKFVGLSVQKNEKILDNYCVSISRPGDLDFWPFDF